MTRLVRSVVVLTLFSLAASLFAGDTIFTLRDPRGDDHAEGAMRYPLNSDIAAGDLDLLSFSAVREEGGTRFEATFARPVKVPTRRPIDMLGTQLDTVARYGFYTFNIDIYIDTDGVSGSGSTTTLPGRRARIEEKHAWERVIALTPRPNESRAAMRDIMTRQAKAEMKSSPTPVSPDEADARTRGIAHDVEEYLYFPTQVHVRGPKIDFFVPDSFLGGPAKAEWGYVVAVSGALLTRNTDVLRTLRGDDVPAALAIMPYLPGRGEENFGGANDSGMQSPFVDILVPAGMKQETILKTYDMRGNTYAELRAVVPAEEKK